MPEKDSRSTEAENYFVASVILVTTCKDTDFFNK